jgi:hypothetical protein
MDINDIKDWVEASKCAVDLLKSAYGALPKGDRRSEVEAKVKVAEDILRRSDAKLAQELGYHLCQCEWPARIMLWREAEKSYICSNETCGRKIKTDFNRPLPRTTTEWAV